MLENRAWDLSILGTPRENYLTNFVISFWERIRLFTQLLPSKKVNFGVKTVYETFALKKHS